MSSAKSSGQSAGSMPILGRQGSTGIVALLLLALVLTGCSTIPEQGPVETGLAPVPVSDNEFVRSLAQPPSPDASPTEIVDGFLRANAAGDADYRVAREFLTSDFSAIWDPAAGVRISEDSSDYELVRSGLTVQVSGQEVGQVSASGEVDSTRPRPFTEGFEMAREEGQWRISSGPAGLLLDRAELEQNFLPINAYFLTPDAELVVPDARYVPRSAPQAVATAAVRVTLDGPSSWLSPGVRSELPADAGQRLASVPVANGVARVDLPPSFLALGDEQRFDAAAQLAWSVAQVPDITAIDLRVDGLSVNLPGTSTPAPLTTWDSYDPQVISDNASLYGTDESGIAVQVDSGELVALPQRGLPIARSVAVEPGGTTWAVLAQGSDRVRIGDLVQPTSPMRAMPSRGSGPLSADRYGRIWWVDKAGNLQVAVPQGNNWQQVSVPLPGWSNAVLGVSVAREGSRVALIVRDRNDRARAGLAVVSGTLEAPELVNLRLSRNADQTVDLSWRDAELIAVLRGSPDNRRLALVDLTDRLVVDVSVSGQAFQLTDAPQSDAVLGNRGAAAQQLTTAGAVTIPGLRNPKFPG